MADRTTQLRRRIKGTCEVTVTQRRQSNRMTISDVAHADTVSISMAESRRHGAVLWIERHTLLSRSAESRWASILLCVLRAEWPLKREHASSSTCREEDVEEAA